MASQLTAQENQTLSRIRERSADAARELAGAVSVRQRLESQLREVQHQMASPDGIASSRDFADDVSRLRREIQIAAEHEQETDAARRRLVAQESLARSVAERRSRDVPRLYSSGSAVRVGAMATIDRGAWMGIVASYRQRRQNYKTMKRREKLAAQAAAGRLKPPSKLVYFPLIYLAVCADLLGILAQVINATGIGAIAVSIVSICISLFFFYYRYVLESWNQSNTRGGQ